jgi:N-formylglutamate amidohydrolase
MLMQTSSCFERFGPATPKSPIVISVPHAGRHYPAEMAALARIGPHKLRPLEDRYADALIAHTVDQGVQAIVAQLPRAWIDLNRDEREFDPEMISGCVENEPLRTAKVRGGLGLIPRRVARLGEIWRRPISADDLATRIAQVHRPYHIGLADLLIRARARFGVAVLIDLHSMPSVADHSSRGAPEIVIGDRFGRSAAGRFTACAVVEAEGFGFRAAVNTPYAGGYILERHGAPLRGIHAIQIEIDRALYLDQLQDQTTGNTAQIQNFVAQVAMALADEALGAGLAIAAE